MQVVTQSVLTILKKKIGKIWVAFPQQQSPIKQEQNNFKSGVYNKIIATFQTPVYVVL